MPVWRYGGHLLHAQNRRGASVWTNQTGARIPSVSLAWTEEGTREWLMICLTQHSEVMSALLWIEEDNKGQKGF